MRVLIKLLRFEIRYDMTLCGTSVACAVMLTNTIWTYYMINDVNPSKAGCKLFGEDVSRRNYTIFLQYPYTAFKKWHRCMFGTETSQKLNVHTVKALDQH